MVIYAISDVHTDYAENMKWLEELPIDQYKSDTVIIAGNL